MKPKYKPGQVLKPTSSFHTKIIIEDILLDELYLITSNVLEEPAEIRIGTIDNPDNFILDRQDKLDLL